MRQEKPYSCFTFQPASFLFLYLVKHFLNDSTFVNYTLLVRKTFCVDIDPRPQCFLKFSCYLHISVSFPSLLDGVALWPPKVSSGSFFSFVDIHAEHYITGFFMGP